MAICYDLRFPELFRNYGLKERVVMQVLPAQWPKIRLEHWRTLSRARAIENQCWFISTGRVGIEHGGLNLQAISLVVNPRGEIISEGGEDEEVILTEIDLDEVSRFRKEFPVLDDVNPNLLI